MGLRIERLKSFASTCNLRNANSVKTVDGNDLTARENTVVDNELDRLIDPRVQFDNRPDSELHDLFENHFGFTETNSNGQLHIQEHRKISVFFVFRLIH